MAAEFLSDLPHRPEECGWGRCYWSGFHDRTLRAMSTLVMLLRALRPREWSYPVQGVHPPERVA